MASTMDSMTPFMPGSYLFQHDHNHVAGASHIFLPPASSPLPSQRFSPIPRPVSRSSGSYPSRKRPRLDTNTSYFSRPVRRQPYNRSNTSTPFSLDGSYDHVTYGNLNSSTYSLEDQGIKSPSPLANSEYRLAGGLDTPCASFEQSLDELAQDEAEKDYRFNRYTTTNTSRTTFSADGSGRFDTQPTTPNGSWESSNSRKRSRPSTLSSGRQTSSITGWGIRNTAWALTGGLAGKVFNFCINTAFRGFNAGGGNTYRIDIVPTGGFEHDFSRPDMFSADYEKTHDIGGFVEDYMNSPELKRQNSEFTISQSQSQSAVDRSAIRNDWQVIDSVSYAAESSDEQHSPVRKRSRASVAGTWQRPVSRNSGAGRTNCTSGASYASPRARPSVSSAYQYQDSGSTANPFQRPIRRSHSSVTANSRHSRSHSHFVGSPGHTTPDRPSSSASMRQRQSNHDNHNSSSSSGLSPEVVNYQRKLKARSKAQDENLRRLNAQLKDMIREGREALGSTVEIVELGHDSIGGGAGLSVNDDFDEGYCEDGWK